MHRVPFYLHDLGEAELDAVREVLAQPILTTGETVARFEALFAERLGAAHAVGLTSCTGALHLALEALGVGPGDEVVTTPMTFVATATAIMHAGATPVLVDVEPGTGNIDAACIEPAVTPRTRAIVPVHLYGTMCDMRAIRAIADRHGLRVVEDAAHCVEGERDGARPGMLSDAACFSFYATKSITCGEGGAVVTNDAELAARLRRRRLHGMTKTAADRAVEGYAHWDVPELGWKYNMDNIQAALLLPQLARLDERWRARAALAARYRAALADLPGVRVPAVPDGARSAWHLLAAWVDPAARDDVVAALHADGIGVVVNYRPIHLLGLLRERLAHGPGDFPRAEHVGASTISLPLYPRLTEADVDLVVGSLRRACYTRHQPGPAPARAATPRER